MSAPCVIRDRLDQLHDQWTAFTLRSAARLLIWQAEPDELAMVSAFVARECEAEAAETPDLFVHLRTPFRAGTPHGDALVSELVAQYTDAAQATDGEHADGEAAAPWIAPGHRGEDDDVATLVAVLASFHRHHVAAGEEPYVAVWLEPESVGDQSAYLRWLARLVRLAPCEVRFLMVASSSDPTHASLVAEDAGRVQQVRCGLDMAAARASLAAKASQGQSGDRYRALLLQLGNVLATDLPLARSLVEEATRLALAEGWPALALVPTMMLAAGCTLHERLEEALAHQIEAERLAGDQEVREREAGTDAPSACGAKLRLQAKLGQAATLLSLAEHARAADLYLSSGVLARELGDAHAELDCQRLASLCLAAQGAVASAWEVGLRGLTLGLAMDEDTRRTSTLPFLAEQLLRFLSEHRHLRDHGPALEAELTRRLGADWRTQIECIRAG